MTQNLPPNHPQRTGFTSGSAFFFYSRTRDEFGTNKRHPASPELAHLILHGLDAYESHQAHVEGVEAFPHEAYEILDESDNLIAVRVEVPKLLFDGLKGCMQLEITPVQRGLVIWAEQDLAAFVSWLGEAGIRAFNPEGDQ